MKYIKEYAFSALAILMASCSSDSDTIEPEAQKPPVASSGTMSFSASIESGETASKATRTSLADANTDSPYPIWSSGDQIKVLNTATSDAQLFSINSSDVGKRAANFTGNIKVETGNNANNKFYAFYAGNVGASTGAPTISMSGSNVTVSGTIPSTQSSTPGFHPELHFMTACTTGSAFSFKNGMALMKVTISDNNYENFKICKIVFKSNNSADNIAGDFTATIGDNGTLSNYSVTNGSSQIVIDGGVGGLSTGTYYIAINPCAFSSGFTLSFIHSITGNYGVTNNQTVELSQYDRIKSTAFNVAASEIINLGTYTAKECAKEAYVDLGLTRNIGGVDRKVLFCIENVYDDETGKKSDVNSSYYSWGETYVKANQNKETECQNYSWYYTYSFTQGTGQTSNDDEDVSLTRRSYKHGVGGTAMGSSDAAVKRWTFTRSTSDSNPPLIVGLTDDSGVLKNYNSLGDYTSNYSDWSGGNKDNLDTLKFVDDAARQKSPQKILRIASEADFKLLMDNSSTDLNDGKKIFRGTQAGSGKKVQKWLNKETGRYLLLPIGGYRHKTSSTDTNELKYGVGDGDEASSWAVLYYWTRDRTATAADSYKARAYKIVQAGDTEESFEDMDRCAGLLVRGVIYR